MPHPPTSSIFTRRRVLVGGASAALLGPGLLAGCSSNQQGAETGTVDTAVLPAYLPFEGIEPDLPAEVDRSSEGFLRYPANPKRVVEDVPGDGKPIGAMVPTSFAVPPPVQKNEFWQAMNERIGSDLDMTIVTAPDYAAKFSTSVAGGQLPDFFQVGPVQSLPTFMEKSTADLTDHLSGDAIKSYPALANLSTDSWKGCVFNGKIRAIPITRGLSNLPVLFVRTDLLADQGITEDPEDFASFSELCKQLTAPKARKWALAGAPLGHLRAMLDIPSPWVMDGDTFVSSRTDERQLEALEAARKLQSAGVINPDGAAIETPVKKGWLGAGTVFMLPDSFIAWFSLYVQHSAVKDFSVHAMSIPGFDGGQGTQFIPIPNVAVTAINAESADRTETLLKVANWLASPFGSEEYLFNKFGIEGVHYTLDGTDPVVKSGAADEVQIGSLYIADANRVLYSPGRGEVVKKAHAYQQKATEKAVKDPTLGLFSETAGKRSASLEKALVALEGDIIAGRKPVSAWTEGTETYLKGGGTKIAEEYTQAHAEREGS